MPAKRIGYNSRAPQRRRADAAARRPNAPDHRNEKPEEDARRMNCNVLFPHPPVTSKWFGYPLPAAATMRMPLQATSSFTTA